MADLLLDCSRADVLDTCQSCAEPSRVAAGTQIETAAGESKDNMVWKCERLRWHNSRSDKGMCLVQRKYAQRHKTFSTSMRCGANGVCRCALYTHAQLMICATGKGRPRRYPILCACEDTGIPHDAQDWHLTAIHSRHRCSPSSAFKTG